MTINELEQIDEDNGNIAYSTSVDVFDSLGAPHKVGINFGQAFPYKTGAAPNTTKGYVRAIQFTNPDLQYLEATGAGAGNAENPHINPVGDNKTTGATESVAAGVNPRTLDNVRIGQLPHLSDSHGGSGTSDGVTDDVAHKVYWARFDSKGVFEGLYDGNQLTFADGAVTTFGTQMGNFAMSLDIPGADDVKIDMLNDDVSPKVNSFKKFTHYAQESSIVGKKLNGRSAGFLESFNVSAAGEFIGIFTNGEQKTMAQVMLANFDNNEGLLKRGGNLFVDTVNSGPPKFGKPGVGSLGPIAPGTLEMSNVDLSNQFTDMITTQRGFQANSRVITTSDEMLQELVNLKR